MGSLRPVSIRTLLVLIVFLACLPAAGIIVVSALKLRTEAMNQARMQTQVLADSIVSEQQHLVAAAQQLASALAQLPEVKHQDAAKVQPILSKIIKLNAQYLNLVIAGRDGTVWASAVPIKPPFSIIDRRFFINAVKSGQFSSGEYIVSRATTKPMFNFGYPFRNEQGQIVGVIGVGFDLDDYRQLLKMNKLPLGSSYALIDHKGVILSRAINPKPYIGKHDSRERMRELEEGPDSATFLGRGLDGVRRLTSCRKLRLEGEQIPYMYVRAGIPLTIALAQSNKAFLYNMTLFVSFLLCAVAVALLIAKHSIVDPISSLKKASDRLAEGDLQVRIAESVTYGELGSLARSFDSMAERLALREKDLIEGERKYRGIFNTTKNAVFVVDIESGKTVEVNKTAESMFGYPREEMLHLTVQEISSGESPYSLREATQWVVTLLHKGNQSFEWLCKKRNGECFWTEVLLSATRVAGKGCALAVLRDISERKVSIGVQN